MNYKFYNFKKLEDGSGEIRIEGDIIDQREKWIYDWFDIDAVAPRTIREQLAELNGADVTVVIDSYGGSYVAGSAIYTELLNYRGQVVGRVNFAYSAASLIAMACDVVQISPSGSIGIHEIKTEAEGDWRDMDHASKFLLELREGLLNAYETKTGLPREEISAMVEADTLMSAHTALRLGFADELMTGPNASAPTDGLGAMRAKYAEKLVAWSAKKRQDTENLAWHDFAKLTLEHERTEY